METLFKASISCVLVINKNLIFLHMELHHFKFIFYLQCRMKATEKLKGLIILLVLLFTTIFIG